VSATQPTVVSQMPGLPSNRIAVVIASVGHPTELRRWIDHARGLTVKPTLTHAVTARQDLPPAGEEMACLRSAKQYLWRRVIAN
jgi:hypothetical protein